MNNVDLSLLENQRKELLKKYGLDTDGIKEFKRKIKKVTVDQSNELGKELFEKLSKKSFNDVDGAIELIYKGANVNYKSEKTGNFPILICARKNYLELFIALLKAGADVNKTNNYKTTALMASARHGCKEILEILILMGANINARCLDGETAIMSAKRHDQTECFNILLNANAYLNNRNLANSTVADLPGDVDFDFTPYENNLVPVSTPLDPSSLIEEAEKKIKSLTIQN